MRRTCAPTPSAALQPCSAKQEPEFGARTSLRLSVRGPECATAWPCPVQQAQPWGPGGTGGPGASQEVALLQQGCPSWSRHTPGVHPSRWAAQAERNWAVRGKSCLEKIPAPWGLQWWKDPSLHKGSDKLQPSQRALPQPIPVPCCPRACDPSTGLGSCCWGWSQLGCLSPVLPHCPAKLACTEQGFAQVSPLGILPLFYAFIARNAKLSFSCLHHHFSR